MKLRFALINRAKGDGLSGFWMLYRLRQRAGPGLRRGVKVGAGAVVARDVPDHCTVVAPPPRFLVPGGGPGFRPGTSSPGSMKRTSAP